MRFPRNLNTVLLIVCLGLLATALWIYHDTTTQGSRFQSGQKLLPSLDIDRIAAIQVGELTLRRSGEEFTISQKNGYPAKNESVNRLIQDLLNITLAKKVSSDPTPEEEVQEVQLLESNGDPMVHLRIGGTSDGGGQYLQRLDGEDTAVYLTEQSLFLDTEPDSYLRKQILNIPRGEVREIRGPGFRLSVNEAGESPLQLVEPASATARTGPLAQLRGLVSPLRFDKVYLADEPEVRDLIFEERFVVGLEGMSYRIQVAESGERTFFRVSGSSDVDRIAINPDDTEEELKGTADFLQRLEGLEDFNRFHGSWVYEAGGTAAEALRVTGASLVE